jgi:molecular chaperone GrpE
MKDKVGGTDERGPKAPAPPRTDDGAGSRKKRMRRGGNDPLHSRLVKLEEELAGEKDRFLRAAADLDNFRKRTERDKARLVLNANADLIRQLLPIVDDLDRSLKKPSDEDAGAFREGIELIRQKLEGVLKNHGLEVMETKGQPFNVDLHEAVMQVADPHAAPDTVVDEYEKGFMLNDRVLRHAKVVVNRAGEEGERA